MNKQLTPEQRKQRIEKSTLEERKKELHRRLDEAKKIIEKELGIK
jgi:hypothetical protein